jgi:hypothetical protein
MPPGPLRGPIAILVCATALAGPFVFAAAAFVEVDVEFVEVDAELVEAVAEFVDFAGAFVSTFVLFVASTRGIGVSIRPRATASR